ncbi:MAG: GtrA family protein [Clostridiales bacterium]|jgi:putative flippase GtrA|nr:GtrA family protein [Clostridiales bacterium]
MKNILNKIRAHPLYKKTVNRETISYCIFGVLTTIVNFISYEGLYRLRIPNLTANWMAWVIAVSFAYVVNKWSVFRSRSSTIKVELAKIMKFYAARLLSLGVEQLGMYVFVELLGINRWLIKASLSIIVIILNYIFSKLYIFQKDNEA